MASSDQQLTHEIRLKRFLYTSSEDGTFITGDPERHNSYTRDNAKVVTDILRSQSPEKLLNILEIVNSENLSTRRAGFFFALSIAGSVVTNENLKRNVYKTLLNIVKSTEELCTFMKFFTKDEKKKFCSSLNKAVGLYYMKMDPFVFAQEVTKSKGYHSWTHKDIIKLAHCKSDDTLTSIVLMYVLFGLKKAIEAAEGKPEAEEIITYLEKVDKLKRCEDEKQLVQLIKELHCNLNRVPSFYHRSLPIWEALIPEMPVLDLITYLPRLYKLGFLKANTPFQSKVVEILTSADKIRASKIHPVEVFIGLRNFEKGGKPLDPKFVEYLEKTAQEKEKEDPNFKKPELTREPPKCPSVISALHKALQLSFQNPSPTGKKIVITIDLNEKMQNPCLNNRNLSCLDAATILTLSLLRTENEVTVAVFNDSKISLVSLEKHITFNQAIAKLKQAKNGYAMQAAVFEWAISKKKVVDVFINLMYYHHWFLLIPKELRDKEKPVDNLVRYRQKMNAPYSKLITFSLSSPHLRVADGTPNILDICGFNKEVPKVIEAFCRGLFC